MKTLYKSILDADDQVATNIDYRIYEPIMTYLEKSGHDLISVELRNGRVVVTPIEKKWKPSVTISYDSEDKLDKLIHSCDASLLKNCYFENVFLVIHPHSNMTDISFINNCKNCDFIYEGQLTPFMIKQFSTYMKKVKDISLRIADEQVRCENKDLYSNVDFGDNRLIFSGSVYLEDIKNLKVGTLGLHAANNILFRITKEEAKKFNTWKQSIDWYKSMSFLQEEVGQFTVKKFWKNNPEIKHLYRVGSGVHERYYIYPDDYSIPEKFDSKKILADGAGRDSSTPPLFHK